MTSPHVAIYAAHMDNALKLSRREGGVSRPQLIRELNITRTVANGLITRCGLTEARTDGRTKFYGPPKAEPVTVKQSRPQLPPEVRGAAVADPEVVIEEETDAIAKLDAEILDTRDTLRAAAKKAGEALGEWATHSAIVDTLRARLVELSTKRMNLS